MRKHRCLPWENAAVARRERGCHLGRRPPGACQGNDVRRPCRVVRNTQVGSPCPCGAWGKCHRHHTVGARCYGGGPTIPTAGKRIVGRMSARLGYARDVQDQAARIGKRHRLCRTGSVHDLLLKRQARCGERNYWSCRCGTHLIRPGTLAAGIHCRKLVIVRGEIHHRVIRIRARSKSGGQQDFRASRGAAIDLVGCRARHIVPVERHGRIPRHGARIRRRCKDREIGKLDLPRPARAARLGGPTRAPCAAAAAARA